MDMCDDACTLADCPGGALVEPDVDPFSADSMHALKAVHITTAILSLLGSAFVICTFHQIPTHRGASLRIVYWLSISNLITSFVYIIDGCTTANEDGAPHCPNGLCVGLAAVSQFFGLAATLWNTFIALNMHLTVLIAARIVKEEDRYMRRLHAGAWGPALLTTVITGAAGGLGSAGQWCWIRGGDFAWAQLLFFYIPIVCSLLYSLGVYLRVRQRIVMLREQAARAGNPVASSAQGELMHRFVSFLIVYGVIHCFRIANRLQDWLAPERPVYALFMLHSIFGPLQGLGNALVYGWTPRVRRLYANLYPGWCGCLDEKAPAAEHKPPKLESGETAGVQPAAIELAEAKPSV